MENFFTRILKSKEEIKWVEGSYIRGATFSNLGGQFFANLMLLLMAAAPVIGITGGPDGPDFAVVGIVSASIILVVNLFAFWAKRKIAKNTYFCITNERVIKKTGLFNDKYVHYSLKNVGNVEVVGSAFDKKGENASATLVVTSKDFHTDTSSKDILKVPSLNNAYEAYKILAEVTEGYNENLRVESK